MSENKMTWRRPAWFWRTRLWMLNLRGKYRIWWGFCPWCNSEAPGIYECPICRGYHTINSGPVTPETKRIWTARYIDGDFTE